MKKRSEGVFKAWSGDGIVVLNVFEEYLCLDLSNCQGYRACLLFVFQRSGERVKGGVVKVDERLKEVFDEV